MCVGGVSRSGGDEASGEHGVDGDDCGECGCWGSRGGYGSGRLEGRMLLHDGGEAARAEGHGSVQSNGVKVTFCGRLPKVPGKLSVDDSGGLRVFEPEGCGVLMLELGGLPHCRRTLHAESCVMRVTLHDMGCHRHAHKPPLHAVWRVGIAPLR